MSTLYSSKHDYSRYTNDIYNKCNTIISDFNINDDINGLFANLEKYFNDELGKHDTNYPNSILNLISKKINDGYDFSILGEKGNQTLQNIFELTTKNTSKLISLYTIKEIPNPNSDIFIRFLNYEIKDNFERMSLFIFLLPAIQQSQQTIVDAQSSIFSGLLLAGSIEIEKTIINVIKNKEAYFLKKYLLPDLDKLFNQTYNKLLVDEKNKKKYNIILKNYIENNLFIFRYYDSILFKSSTLLYEIIYLLYNINNNNKNIEKTNIESVIIIMFLLISIILQSKISFDSLNSNSDSYFQLKEKIKTLLNDVINNFNIISESNSIQKENDNINIILKEYINKMYELDMNITGHLTKYSTINDELYNVLKYILFSLIKYDAGITFQLDLINEQLNFMLDRLNTIIVPYNENLETEKILNAIIEDIERNDLFIKDSEILFTIENLSHCFGKNIIFENVNLTIPKNSWICLYGNSGSGKSTLCNIILQQLEPDMCTIKYMGKHTDYKYTDLSKDISYVTASPEVFENTILYNIVYGVINSEDKEIQEKMNYYVKLFGLDVCDLKDNVNTLSTGQKQRVSIIRLILQDRPIMILDEITSNIDNEMEKIILEEIRKIQKEKNKTVIHITHNIENKVFSDINLYILNKDIIQVN